MIARIPEGLRGRLGESLTAAELVRLTIELPHSGPSRLVLPGTGALGFSWAQPAHDLAFCTRGAVATIVAKGTERFAAVAAGARDLAARCIELGAADAPDDLPFWVGGFAFDPEGCRREPWRELPAALWWIPETLLVRRAGRVWAVLAARADRARSVSATIARFESLLRALLEDFSAREDRPSVVASAPGTSGDRATFCERVRDARDAVRSGALEKLVVARALRLTLPEDVAVEPILERLARHQVGCRLFVVRAGRTTFLGSSPERLVSVYRGEVRADALAGTAPRGDDAAGDDAFARTLRESKKEQEEHAVVARALRDALIPLCGALHVPEAPIVRRLATLQHLHTPIRGRLREPRPFSVLALAERLHPTPAVAGAPRNAALAWLRRHEGIERGWYAGLVGWLDRRGDGDLAVALRSALLRPGAAWLYAGAGIVAGSEPGAELDETDLKLRTMRDALTGGAP